MKATELLRLGKGVLETMAKNGIMRDDYKYIESYEAFLNMRRNKMKYKAAIAMLAEENDVSERTLERIFKRLSKEI